MRNCSNSKIYVIGVLCLLTCLPPIIRSNGASSIDPEEEKNDLYLLAGREVLTLEVAREFCKQSGLEMGIYYVDTVIDDTMVMAKSGSDNKLVVIELDASNLIDGERVACNFEWKECANYAGIIRNGTYSYMDNGKKRTIAKYLAIPSQFLIYVDEEQARWIEECIEELLKEAWERSII